MGSTPSEKIEEDDKNKYNINKLAKFAINAFKVHIGKELEASEFKYDPNFDFKSTASTTFKGRRATKNNKKSLIKGKSYQCVDQFQLTGNFKTNLK